MGSFRAALLGSAVLAAGVVLRFVQLQHPLDERMAAIVAYIAVPVFLGLLICFAIERWLFSRWPRWLMAILAMGIATLGMVAAPPIAYGIFDRLILGNIEDDSWEDFWFHGLAASQAGAWYIFVAAALRYFFPWPVAVAAVLVGLVVYLRPRLSKFEKQAGKSATSAQPPAQVQLAPPSMPTRSKGPQQHAPARRQLTTRSAKHAIPAANLFQLRPARGQAESRS